MSARIEELREGGPAICKQLLDALPKWFGIQEAVDSYSEGVERCRCWVARDDERVIGLIAMDEKTEATEEVYVMAVAEDHHRKGIGRQLLEAAEDAARAAGRKLLMVKTLSSARPHELYARTRAFYRGVGFEPLEERPLEWDAANPCLVLVKAL